MTRTIWTNFRSRVLRSLHIKFEFNWPSGFREDVWKCWQTTDGRRSHWYTISSPMSLRLRWAKKSADNKSIKNYLASKELRWKSLPNFRALAILNLMPFIKKLLQQNYQNYKFRAILSTIQYIILYVNKTLSYLFVFVWFVPNQYLLTQFIHKHAQIQKFLSGVSRSQLIKFWWAFLVINILYRVGSICFSMGSAPVFWRKPIATCDFQGGGV